jgi:hypothetical protein
MSEEENQTVSDMLRTVAENNHNFLNAVADRIAAMETYIARLQQQITELDNSEEKCNDENM